MDLLSTILQNAPGLMAAFTGATTAPNLKQQNQLAGQEKGLADALANHNSAGYQNLFQGYRDQNQQDLARGLAEAQGQNRLNAGMGRTALFDPSRGGETLFRTLMQGYQDAGSKADTQTTQALSNALAGSQTALQGYGNVSTYGKAANAAKLSGFDTLAKSIFGGGNTNTASTSPSQSLYGASGSSPMYSYAAPGSVNKSYDGSTINWNQPTASDINWNQPSASDITWNQPRKAWTG